MVQTVQGFVVQVPSSARSDISTAVPSDIIQGHVVPPPPPPPPPQSRPPSYVAAPPPPPPTSRRVFSGPPSGECIPPPRWGWNFAYFNLMPYKRHTFILIGDGEVDLWTVPDNMLPNWEYYRSGNHGRRNFTFGVSSFSASYRYHGSDAPDLVTVVFEFDSWASEAYGYPTYVAAPLMRF